MKVMFMGTPQIATNCLSVLFEKHDVCCVVTKEDKPKGRGGVICCSAVKETAQRRRCAEIVQPKTLKDGKFLSVLQKHNPDVIVVVAYGLILPKYVLEYPKYGCINLHASLLPKYRGAAPIQWCIVKGEKVGGVTTMLMDEGLDTGDILLQAEVDIPPDMTGGQLHDEYCRVGSALILETLEKLEKGEITPKKQNDSDHTYAPMLNYENTKIDWSKSAADIVNLVRALNPYPCAHTTLGGKKLKVFECKAANAEKGVKGEVLSAEGGLTVSCGDGAVVITELQLEGKKRMDAQAFLRGFKAEKGEQLV
ncbi:MAG: methionyl-tRNA formyltransferase [Firmicutes bacterium]|nr:methionyl-tRNA formyltransferase [Bacillota bacterium]